MVVAAPVVVEAASAPQIEAVKSAPKVMSLGSVTSLEFLADEFDVSPDAVLKVFLTASAEARAERRYKQLIEKGFSAKLQDILQDLEDRDARDAARTVAPLRQEADAKLLETSNLTIVQAVDQVLDWSGNKAS